MTEHPQDGDEQVGTDPSVDVTGESGEQESYHGYSVDDETQPQGSGDSLAPDRGLTDPLEEGYSPPEKWSAGQGYGNTPLEEAQGESLDQRLAQEEPEVEPYAEATRSEHEDEDVGGEVGTQRAGRLREEDAGTAEDAEQAMLADDVGIDGAGASAEEAGVHVIDEDTERET